MDIQHDHTDSQGAVPLWQCGKCRKSFFENVRLLFKNALHFKDIFRKFEAF
jgi:hypothetical protein